MRTSWQKMPCVMAFLLERAFPSGVRGPVDFFALRWLARRLRSEIGKALRGMARLLSGRERWDVADGRARTRSRAWAWAESPCHGGEVSRRRGKKRRKNGGNWSIWK